MLYNNVNDIDSSFSLAHDDQYTSYAYWWSIVKSLAGDSADRLNEISWRENWCELENRNDMMTQRGPKERRVGFWEVSRGDDWCQWWRWCCLGSKRKSEDTFGMNDDDWDLYKQIVSRTVNCTNSIQRVCFVSSSAVKCIIWAIFSTVWQHIFLEMGKCPETENMLPAWNTTLKVHFVHV